MNMPPDINGGGKHHRKVAARPLQFLLQSAGHGAWPRKGRHRQRLQVQKERWAIAQEDAQRAVQPLWGGGRLGGGGGRGGELGQRRRLWCGAGWMCATAADDGDFIDQVEKRAVRYCKFGVI